MQSASLLRQQYVPSALASFADVLCSEVKEHEPRLCDYTGLYYCPNCHWNDEMIIPARVVHNWDFTPQRVCRATKQFLKIMFRKPVLKLESMNPALFNLSEEMRLIRVCLLARV